MQLNNHSLIIISRTGALFCMWPNISSVKRFHRSSWFTNSLWNDDIVFRSVRTMLLVWISLRGEIFSLVKCLANHIIELRYFCYRNLRNLGNRHIRVPVAWTSVSYGSTHYTHRKMSSDNITEYWEINLLTWITVFQIFFFRNFSYLRTRGRRGNISAPWKEYSICYWFLPKYRLPRSSAYSTFLQWSCHFFIIRGPFNSCSFNFQPNHHIGCSLVLWRRLRLSSSMDSPWLLYHRF